MRGIARLNSWMLVMAFVLSAVLAASPAAKAQDEPDLSVSVMLRLGTNGTVQRTYQLGDPLEVSIAIENATGGELIVSANFPDRDYHLDLHFTRFLPGGGSEVITTSVPVNLNEPPKPKMRFTSGGQVVNLRVEQVAILPDGWVSGADWFDALEFYPLLKAGRYEVRAVIPRELYDTPVLASDDGFSYKELGSSTVEGDLISTPEAFHVVDDSDGDGYTYPEAYGASPSQADCNDTDAAVYPGAQEVLGDGIDNDCDHATPDIEMADPGFVQILAHKHTVGTGSHPGSTKEPIADMPVRIYDMSEGSCVKTRYGVSWQNYPNIWWGCNPAVVEGMTNNEGEATLPVPPGTYLVIGLQDLGGEPRNDEDIYIGRSVGEVASGATVDKYLQIIAKANGKKVPGKYNRRTGSDLLIIEPEYVEWDGDEEFYPFIFESVGDWSVTTSVAPPEGFLSDHDALSAEVNTEIEALQFVITDIGSEWISTGVVHDVKHKGKKEKIKSKIGVKLSKKLAKHKGLDRYGKKLKGKKIKMSKKD